MPGDLRPRVVVVGGGITGLACAWYLREKAEVSVFEAGDRAGGKITTHERWGVPVEAGPDLFLARLPWAPELCRDLGLGDDLVSPATNSAFVWAAGHLTRLPEGLVLGVPTRLGPVLRSRLLSPAGLARAGLDLVLPRSRLPPDPSVADVIGGRFGPEVLDRLVEPLLGGIHAGRADRLSIRAVAPEVGALAEANRSLLLGARRRRTTPAASGGPVFQSVSGGLNRLTQRLAEDLGPRIRLDTRVVSVRRWAEGGLAVDIGETIVGADHVVVATPAPAASTILGLSSATASGELASVRYSSVATVTLAYRPSDVGHPLDGSGFVVPRGEGRLVTACTFLTSKWPALKEAGHVLVRASCGRVDDERWLAMDDAALVGAVHSELTQALGLRAQPLDSLVARWPSALPQYEPGHGARLDRVRQALAADLPGAHLAGAAYGGLGIAACVRQARETAEAIAP